MLHLIVMLGFLAAGLYALGVIGAAIAGNSEKIVRALDGGRTMAAARVVAPLPDPVPLRPRAAMRPQPARTAATWQRAAAWRAHSCAR